MYEKFMENIYVFEEKMWRGDDDDEEREKEKEDEKGSMHALFHFVLKICNTTVHATVGRRWWHRWCSRAAHAKLPEFRNVFSLIDYRFFFFRFIFHPTIFILNRTSSHHRQLISCFPSREIRFLPSQSHIFFFFFINYN